MCIGAIMKPLSLFACGIMVLFSTLACAAQTPIISSFNYSGELVCINLTPGSIATIEWAPSVTGPWTNTWAGCNSMTVGLDGRIQAVVPMYYRVHADSTVAVK